jgi:hypothetical protein
MAEVPEQRAHQGGVLARERVVVERVRDLQGPRPHRAQEIGRAGACCRYDGARTAQEQEREVARRVGVGLLERQAESSRGAGDLLHAALAAHLGTHPLAGREADLAVEEGHPDDDLPPELEVHLYLLAAVLVEGHVVERVQRHIGPELPVGAIEEVLREAGAPSRAVVVRGLEARRVLDEVDPEEEPLAGLERAGREREEGVDLGGLEVADARPQEDDQARSMAARAGQRVPEGRGERPYRQPRELRAKCAPGGLERVGVDVDGDMGGLGPRAERAQQQARLLGALQCPPRLSPLAEGP